MALKLDVGSVLAWRRAMLATLAGLALLGGAGAMRLETRFDPEELVAVDADVQRERADIEARFGAEAAPILVLFEAREGASTLLEDATLADVHALALALARLDGVERVDGPTTTPLPMPAVADPTTLDDLEAQPDGSEALLRAVVETDRDRFPLGLMSVAGAVPTLRAVGRDGVLAPGASEELRTVLAATPLLRRRLVSDDERVVVLAASTRRDLDRSEEARLLARVQLLVGAAARPGAGVSVTGLAAMRAEMEAALSRDQGRLISLALLGTVLVLIFGMRTIAGVVLPLGAVGISLALSLGAMSIHGTPLDLLTNMLPPLLLTIGLAEAMHMVVRYRDELAGTTDRIAAATATLRHMWLPCFVTTFTTAIGFAALIGSESEALRRFGIVASLATMVGYLVTVLFVPAALPSFGPGTVRGGVSSSARSLEAVLVRVADAVSLRPWASIGGALAFGLIALGVARNVEVESRLLDQFARGSEVARTSAVLEADLDGFRALDLVLEGPPGTFRSTAGMEILERVSSAARESPAVLRVTTAADWAREALARIAGDAAVSEGPFTSSEQVAALLALVARADTALLARFVTVDGGAARIELRVSDVGASRTLALVERLRRVASGGPVTRVLVGGEAYAASRGLERIVSALGGLAAAIFTIFLVMTLLFRSLRLGLLSIPPNVLPLLATLAYMVLRGIALHAATVIVFTVTVGLSVDGTTHVVSRFREELENAEREGLGRAEVLRRTVAGSGRAVLLSSLTLIVGYAALLSSSFEPVRLFGELSAISIVGATISQTIFLPALLSVWGMPRGRAQIERRPSNDEMKAASSGK